MGVDSEGQDATSSDIPRDRVGDLGESLGVPAQK